MSEILQRIAARTRHDLADRRRRVPPQALQARFPEGTRDFAAALRSPDLSLIAELKPRSPSRGALRPDADPAVYARAYGRAARAASVLCDQPFFGGGYPLLAAFRAHSDLPLLAKDFVLDPYQLLEARAHGADAVLLMASLLEGPALAELLAAARELGLQALVEVHDPRELEVALAVQAEIIGVNARDLRTLRVDLEGARALLARVPADRVRVAESGVRTRAQADALRGLADAVLVGTALMQAQAPEDALRELGWC